MFVFYSLLFHVFLFLKRAFFLIFFVLIHEISLDRPSSFVESDTINQMPPLLPPEWPALTSIHIIFSYGSPRVSLCTAFIQLHNSPPFQFFDYMPIRNQNKNASQNQTFLLVIQFLFPTDVSESRSTAGGDLGNGDQRDGDFTDDEICPNGEYLCSWRRPLRREGEYLAE